MFKANLLRNGWTNKRLDNVKKHGTNVKKNIYISIEVMCDIFCLWCSFRCTSFVHWAA